MQSQEITLSDALIARITALLRNGTVVSSAITAAIPVFVLGWIARPVLNPVLPAAVIAALGGGAVFGAFVFYLNRRATDRTLLAYVKAMELAAEGDLSQRLDVTTLNAGTTEGRALVRLGLSINRMLERLENIVNEISTALSSIDQHTDSILQATQRQIEIAQEQENVVTETTATVEELEVTVSETAERAQSVAETAQLSVNISRNGTDAVSETVDGMENIRTRVQDIADNILALSEQTQQIEEIIQAVNALADQSRMLALNASVEAARAGEEGKGFAVVALEVRNLADQNRDATVQVREILGDIQRATNTAVMVTEEGSKGVDAGQNLVHRAGDSILELSKAINNSATAALQIAASTRQQSIGMEQLTDAMRTIKHVTAETVSSTMQVETSVQRLRESASRVNALLAALKSEV